MPLFFEDCIEIASLPLYELDRVERGCIKTHLIVEMLTGA